MDLSIIADEGDTILVRCEGEISNAFRAGGGDEPLETLLGGPDGLKRKILLNLEKVRFLDSSGIGWLLVHHKHSKERGGRFVLYEVPPLILQTLGFLNLSSVLLIARDEAGARVRAGGDQP
jgi:anti-anti-sigma factor